MVEIFTARDVHPQPDWLDSVITYKAKNAIEAYLASLPKSEFRRCSHCLPIPGDEVIGFRDEDGEITIHKRDCDIAIRPATQQGDNIVSVDYKPDDTLYPVAINVTAVDRYHLFIDLVDCITNDLNLSMDSFNTETVDSIVTCRIAFRVHSEAELQTVIHHIRAIPGVDTVARI